MNDDPYRPPAADVTVGDGWQATWPWKLFFVVNVLLLLVLLRVPGLFARMNVFDAVDFVLSMLGLVGIFGLAFHRRIGGQGFWRVLFYVLAAESMAYSLLLPLIGVKSYGREVVWDGVKLFEIGFALLAVCAVYLYAFRRAALWGH